MINFDKFLASFIEAMKAYRPTTIGAIPFFIKKALEDQGLAYKDGEIIKTQRRISAEAKESGYGESEDERIRKALIEYFNEQCDMSDWNGVYGYQVVAWLEKQGELAENNKDGVDGDFTIYYPLKNGKGIYECIPYSFYGMLSSFSEDKDMIDFLHLCFYTEEECNEWIKRHESTDICIKNKEFPASEKRDFGYFSEPIDKKPIGKIESKFNVGDWVVNGNVIAQILDVQKQYYVGLDTEGNDFTASRFLSDDKIHLWTIKDAKDGDVLVHNECTFIFMGIKDGIVKAFEENLLDGTNPVNFGESDKDKDYCPATNEQRDTLFAKMHEAGYTFDFEKKKLKKIKFRVGDEVITENEESLTITRIDEEGYWSNDLFICNFDEECIWDLVEQKPVEWKQENREELTDFENAMMHIGDSFFGENAGLDPNDTDTIKEQAELLLELAPKIEWSEEDEVKINRIVSLLENLKVAENDILIKDVNWLKSIKDRYTWKPSEELDEASYRVGIKHVLDNPESYGLTKYNWKPSDEQLYFLHWLANNILTDGEVDKKASEILNTLYDDLKKL